MLCRSQSPRKGNPLTFTTAQVNTLFPDISIKTFREPAYNRL
jgi:hypothetical protein